MTEDIKEGVGESSDVEVKDINLGCRGTTNVEKQEWIEVDAIAQWWNGDKIDGVKEQP